MLYVRKQEQQQHTSTLLVLRTSFFPFWIVVSTVENDSTCCCRCCCCWTLPWCTSKSTEGIKHASSTIWHYHSHSLQASSQTIFFYYRSVSLLLGAFYGIHFHSWSLIFCLFSLSLSLFTLLYISEAFLCRHRCPIFYFFFIIIQPNLFVPIFFVRSNLVEAIFKAQTHTHLNKMCSS